MTTATLNRLAGKYDCAEVREWVCLLLDEAICECGWRWVKNPSRQLIAATVRVWDVVAPGWTMTMDRNWGVWLRDSSETIAALLAHSGIWHHLRMVGLNLDEGDTFDPVTLAVSACG